eukprot:RCo049247
MWCWALGFAWSLSVVCGFPEAAPAEKGFVLSQSATAASPEPFCKYLTRAQPIPIEPLVTEPLPYRHNQPGLKNHDWDAVRARLKAQTRLASFLPIEKASRRVYLDLGGRDFNSSVKGFFLAQYPKASLFDNITVFEVAARFRASYHSVLPPRGPPWVSFRTQAVWISDGRVWASMGKMASLRAAGDGFKFNRTRPLLGRKRPVSVPSIDFSRYLRETFTLSDFVVVKMDIEGAEYQIIPKLLQEGTVDLIDELFLECHYFKWCWQITVVHKKWEDCLGMFQTLRNRGVYVHEW